MRIKQLLKNKGITQKELAKRIGITPQALHSRLKNDNPTFDTMLLISKAIGCEAHELFEPSIKYAHFYHKGEWLGIRRI